MKKRFFAMITALVIAVSCFTVTVFAQTSYCYALSFQGQHFGETRDYTGNTMHWRGSTHTEYQEPDMPRVFFVSLYRKNTFGSTLIGEAVQCNRVGYHNLTWENVGSGRYYFFYSKARDGANVVSSGITMEMS